MLKTKPSKIWKKKKLAKKSCTVNGTVQQVQIANEFAILEVDEGENNENKQLVLVEESNEQMSSRHHPNTTPVFNSTSPGTGVSIEGNKGISQVKDKKNPSTNKESTSQWVQRTFGANLVTTNTSCQEIHSQNTLEADAMIKESGRIQLGQGNLWSDQIEEDSEEDNLFGDEEDSDDLPEEDQEGVEEQSENGQGVQAMTTNNEKQQPQ